MPAIDDMYDALLLVSFGGPEGPDDVLPFLENVLRGKPVPRARMLEVAAHYDQFAGVSPINAQNRALIAALRAELDEHHVELPIYWGNRNWHPLLHETFKKMAGDGVGRALAFVTSVFSSYSGCRQYLEDIQRARLEVGAHAPRVDKLRSFYNHPGFVETMADRLLEALGEVPLARRHSTRVIFTAHSIPSAMAAGCPYVQQLSESCRLVSESASVSSWQLVYQSRSGPPSQPWLEPDVCDYLEQVAQEASITDVVVVPIGFVSDHMEVLYDLDTEAQQLCGRLGLNMVRAKTAGTHPRFVRMIRELILERTCGAEKLCCGPLGPSPDVCPEGCCPYAR